MYSNPVAEFNDIFSQSYQARKDSMKENFRKGRTCSWIMGNRIIKITTGLYSGICADDAANNRENNSICSSTSSSSNGNSNTTNGVSNANKSEQELFDETIDESEAIENKMRSNLVLNRSNGDSFTNNFGNKRRYNSGTVDQNKYKLSDSRQSKDDCSLSTTCKLI